MQKEKYLIVNADDFGLVPSVSEGILDAHEKGIVTSTTAFSNLAIHRKFISRAKRLKRLGVGLHLNLVLGEPVSKAEDVASLLDENGRFARLRRERIPQIKACQLEREWLAQIARFKKMWGRVPTHLDSHHHTHSDPKLWRVFMKLARKFDLPFRPASLPLARSIRSRFLSKGVVLPERFLGDMDPKGHWRKESLLKALKRVRPGVQELMCHPGWNSPALCLVSSFQAGREAELKALMSQEARAMIKQRGIQLINFGDLCR